MEKSLTLRAVEDLLIRRYPEATTDEKRKELLALASIRVSSVLKEIVELRRAGNFTDADSLLVDYRKAKAQAQQYARDLGVEFTLRTVYMRENLQSHVAELKSYGGAGTGDVFNQMARVMELAMVRGAVDECREAGMPEAEIREILGEYAEEGLKRGPITAHISG